MKLTKNSILKIKQTTTNKLKKEVCSYILERWSDYNDKKGIFTDVLYNGCQSGIVGSLIYYDDTVKFYKKYQNEINKLLYDTMENCGVYSLKELFNKKWEDEDPLANDIHNQNLLAWFGFEETLRNIGLNFEVLDDYI